ncbi:EmrA/EmrK family multidrug efflux transporter periplasmic adaptor subunit [Candidatus Palibaumannia cicadellinicola]|uniref:EmrA/EmrK family multidrug efflux transporter periplasmic adaptor subunit n=1 Tax=Candidatus Palibaumannia cicadellinicola TaxID=186490 RepID=A0A2N4XW60_9GAMM|nr:efflux RND transporter periplasmic adaptor subunit [Candidatus Baumannia cicadellinicola]PLK58182.1 EmrA/EmrK family multidrug efflux transporter periplasmic adaptor subunit [Candidatus Baumannia cicadellinicola]
MVDTYFTLQDDDDKSGSHNVSSKITPPKNIPIKLTFLIIFVLLLIIISIYYWFYNSYYESTNDAYVTGNLIQITPQLVGTVTLIVADDGDFVKQGQLLVQLDSSDTIVEQENAEANLAKVVRQVCRISSNVESYKNKVATRKIELQRAHADYQRSANLARKGIITSEELSHAWSIFTSAETLLTSAQQQLETLIVLVDNTTITAHPDVKNAAAHLRSAYLHNQRSSLVAPVSGYVAKRSVQIGSYVKPGAALMAIVSLDDLWIEANFKETQLLSMRIGQPVEIKTDLYGNKVTYHGKVESLGIGTGSVFSLLPAQNASGNWIKIIQRLPVRIRLEPDNLDRYPLRIGLSANVKVDLHNDQGPMLAPYSMDKIRYMTEVYNHQLHKADSLVTKIISDNCEDALSQGKLP